MDFELNRANDIRVSIVDVYKGRDVPAAKLPTTFVPRPSDAPPSRWETRRVQTMLRVASVSGRLTITETGHTNVSMSADSVFPTHQFLVDMHIPDTPEFRSSVRRRIWALYVSYDAVMFQEANLIRD